MSLDISELSCHLAGQLVAAHPAYDALFDGFTLAEDRGNKAAREEWACGVLFAAAKASKWLGLTAHAVLGRGLLAVLLPVAAAPRRPHRNCVGGTGAAVAADPRCVTRSTRRVWTAYEIHPGDDLHDGVSFERLATTPTRASCVAEGSPCDQAAIRGPKFNAHDREMRHSIDAFIEMGEGTISVPALPEHYELPALPKLSSPISTAKSYHHMYS
ncbi:hypothetical protein GLOTRDRAFT_132314 [Gloeophyllum trabeum ATCC 11539]|uniref:Uncharacterized protein n=1 Tax=Gloeophyllum trabeum (strain ATCC 11539 / FP-39264 / Madison 617) TaxID=670483 RepID=S7PXX5_GLOTA|nr:uncharacterized protein GLOTRDRAFT_132314 [Gloeophyllum trabeum ATCC 11539]EPQ52197.1 hypothetical protein GLOTRDRAFT_132314 [Gloeophyllum trabeum ATCC 11539]